VSSESSDANDQAPHLQGEDAGDRIVAALAHFRTSAARDGTASWESAPAWQEACLKEWASHVGLLLEANDYVPFVERGGQEHDVIAQADRYIKVTRGGYFGFSPGIELALVPSGQDARRFHLWEALPYQYLERLRLQNQLVPGLNCLEGIIVQQDELSIIISQERFDINPVTQDEITQWFAALGFTKITTAAYYRREDNLGVFDAHDKNVVRATSDPSILIPFDVIPVHPDGGFLSFIDETLAAGDSINVVRSTHTTSHISAH
jgi:hypothetical protein